MRKSHVAVAIAVVVLVAPRVSLAQGIGAGAGSGPAAGASTATVTTAGGGTYTLSTQDKPGAKPRVEEPDNARFAANAITNVQVELTITDQRGATAPEKKTVTMVVSSGSWGRIRSAGSVPVPGNPPVVVDLNVDARPRILLDGPIQLELTIAYSPMGPSAGESVGKPPTVNQSLTVVLQNGKPLVLSQAADPVGDRKIIVEAKATILK